MMKQTGCLILQIKLVILILFSSLGFHGVLGSPEGERPICLYYLKAKAHPHLDSTIKDQLLGDDLVLCGDPSDYCFSYWKSSDESPSNNSALDGSATEAKAADNSFLSTKNMEWLARGCFLTTDSCEQETCVAKEKATKNSYFCCCKGNRCNDKISIRETPASLSINPEPIEKQIHWNVMSICLCVLALIIISLFLLWIIMRTMPFRKLKKSQTPLAEEKCSLSSSIDLNQLNFLDVVGKGRYGTVYRALFNDEVVAVKLIAQHAKSIFTDEKYIYSLPLMDHPNLLSYLGGGEVTGPDYVPYHGLVLSYCNRGRLNVYLMENTLDWSTFCRIVITLTRGLGHLHSDVKKGDLFKPCIAHRDFNTRNLLLKDDLTCVVSDLGFAIHTQGSKYFQNDKLRSAEIALKIVGTLRYMAPELLEGSVNILDCGTSLKQNDVYALGLVLWEVASRCHDLHEGTPTPEYALPYEDEVGLHPSREEMEFLVAKKKARPFLPAIWKDTNPAIRLLKETIKDCWDDHPSARPTVMLVESRLERLPKFWKG